MYVPQPETTIVERKIARAPKASVSAISAGGNRDEVRCDQCRVSGAISTVWGRAVKISGVCRSA